MKSMVIFEHYLIINILFYFFCSSLQVVCMHHISKQLSGFSNLPYQVSGNAEFLDWVESGNPEHSVPECWDTESELSK